MLAKHNRFPSRKKAILPIAFSSSPPVPFPPFPFFIRSFGHFRLPLKKKKKKLQLKREKEEKRHHSIASKRKWKLFAVFSPFTPTLIYCLKRFFFSRTLQKRFWSDFVLLLLWKSIKRKEITYPTTFLCIMHVNVRHPSSLRATTWRTAVGRSVKRETKSRY